MATYNVVHTIKNEIVKLKQHSHSAIKSSEMLILLEIIREYIPVCVVTATTAFILCRNYFICVHCTVARCSAITRRSSTVSTRYCYWQCI